MNLFGEKKDSIDYKNITQNLIKQIARTILSNYVLVANASTYRIMEIEFYVHGSNHLDTYTHGNPDQLTYGKWYFHKFATGSYKGGTFKGLDITLGSSDAVNPVRLDFQFFIIYF